MTENSKFKIAERPVAGDINQNLREPVDQWNSTEFLAALDKVLELPRVKAVVWDQYTPYFNDGDECVFSVNEPRIVFETESKDEDEDEDYDDEDDTNAIHGGWRDYGYGYTDSDLYTRKGDDWSNIWDHSVTPSRINLDKVSFIGKDGVDYQPYYEVLHEFAGNTSRWESVARANFGDHAEVTATKEGFNVEFYEHD